MREVTVQEVKEALLTVGNLLPSDAIKLCMSKGDEIIKVIKEIAVKYGTS